MRSGVEASEVPVEFGLARPVAGGVDHHQRCVDGHNALAAHVGLQLGQHLVVGARDAHVAKHPGIVDRGHPGRAALTPREVDSDEVHTPNRKL